MYTAIWGALTDNAPRELRCQPQRAVDGETVHAEITDICVARQDRLTSLLDQSLWFLMNIGGQ